MSNRFLASNDARFLSAAGADTGPRLREWFPLTPDLMAEVRIGLGSRTQSVLEPWSITGTRVRAKITSEYADGLGECYRWECDAAPLLEKLRITADDLTLGRYSFMFGIRSHIATSYGSLVGAALTTAKNDDPDQGSFEGGGGGLRQGATTANAQVTATSSNQGGVSSDYLPYPATGGIVSVDVAQRGVGTGPRYIFGNSYLAPAGVEYTQGGANLSAWNAADDNGPYRITLFLGRPDVTVAEAECDASFYFGIRRGLKLTPIPD